MNIINFSNQLKSKHLDKSSLSLYHKTYYSNIFFYDKNRNYILKERISSLATIKEYENIEFLKNRRYPYIPPTSLFRTKGRTFIIQKFLKGSPIILNKDNPNNIHIIGHAIGRLHSIRKTEANSLRSFLKDKMISVGNVLDNCVFLIRKMELRQFLPAYTTLRDYLKTFKEKICREDTFDGKIHYSFLHGEFDNYHFILYKNRLYIIDMFFLLS